MSLRTRCFSTSRTIRAGKSKLVRRMDRRLERPWPLPEDAFDDPLLTGSPYIDLLRFFRYPMHHFIFHSINQYDDLSHFTLIFAKHICKISRAESFLQAAQKRLQFATQPELKVVRFLCCYHERALTSLCSITPFVRFLANDAWLALLLNKMLFECWRDRARREEVSSLIVEAQILNRLIRVDVAQLQLERSWAQVLPVNERHNAHMKGFQHIYEQFSQRSTASERKRTRARAKSETGRFSLSSETTRDVTTALGFQLQRKYLDILDWNKWTRIFEFVQQEPNMIPTLAIRLYLDHLISLIQSHHKVMLDIQRKCELIFSSTRTVVPTAKTKAYGSLWRVLTVSHAKQYLMREELSDLRTELYEFSMFKVAHTDSVAPVQLLENSRRLITQAIQKDRARDVKAWLTVEDKHTHSNQYHRILPHAKTLSEGPYAYFWREVRRRAIKAAQKDGSELPCGPDRDANWRPAIPRRAVTRSQKEHPEANTSAPSPMDREGTWRDHASDLITAIDRLKARQ